MPENNNQIIRIIPAIEKEALRGWKELNLKNSKFNKTIKI